jgi:thiamine biosynthesis lipoprotein
MGTAISLDIADPHPGEALPAARLESLADQVFAWMREVDRRFSTYRDDSEVIRLDRGDLTIEDASTGLRHVLNRCAVLWRETDGYFDAYATGGLDPSGYVKGWAVQVASDRLVHLGVPNHCINAGGDVRVRGHRAPGQPWRIGIRHPWDARHTCWVLSGTDLSVATSGVYERGHHVLDPHTGRPATGLRSVTVAGPGDLGDADAYATAALAMGPAGLDWLNRLPGYECAVVTDDRQLYRSPGLPTAPTAAPTSPGDPPT